MEVKAADFDKHLIVQKQLNHFEQDNFYAINTFKIA